MYDARIFHPDDFNHPVRVVEGVESWDGDDAGGRVFLLTGISPEKSPTRVVIVPANFLIELTREGAVI